MARSNKHLATVTLGVAALGLVASYPFSQGFWGGLAVSGCSAALVGGMADWFAVTALFRRPLGIGYHTAIIPRNRQRITQAMVQMVEEELLTKENIARTLENYDIIPMLLQYLAQPGVSTHIKEMVGKLSDEMWSQVNSSQLSVVGAKFLRSQAEHIHLAQLLVAGIGWTVDKGYLNKLIKLLIGELAVFCGEEQVNHLLELMLEEARHIYEKDWQRRQIAGQFLVGLGVTAAGLAKLAQGKILAFLGEAQDQDHWIYSRLEKKAAAYRERLAEDQDLVAGIEQWKVDQLSQEENTATAIKGLLDELLSGAQEKPGRAEIHGWLGQQVDNMFAAIKANPSLQQKVSSGVKQLLLELINNHHDQIGSMVQEQLDALTTDDLVKFVETKVGNDLQYIRMNGSVMGGLVGLVIYLVSYGW